MADEDISTTETGLSCTDICYIFIIGMFALLLLGFSYLGRIGPIGFILGMLILGVSVILLALRSIQSADRELDEVFVE
ncbi:MAG: hypothetical protein RTU30_16415 [Candidatus Thorarchaeota archaeon]